MRRFDDPRKCGGRRGNGVDKARYLILVRNIPFSFSIWRRARFLSEPPTPGGAPIFLIGRVRFRPLRVINFYIDK